MKLYEEKVPRQSTCIKYFKKDYYQSNFQSPSISQVHLKNKCNGCKNSKANCLYTVTKKFSYYQYNY